MNDIATPAPARETLTLAGERFSCLRYGRAAGGDGAPLLHWTHATGFNAATYRHLLAPLAEGMDVLALDMRGHGFSEAAADPARLDSWDVYRDDLVALIDALDRPLYLAGHSFGAVASIGAALRRPRQVLGLVLVEPVLMNRLTGLGLRVLQTLGLSHRFAMAEGAARRRSVFADKRSALERYKGRGAFSTWPEGWLRDYLDGGLRERPDGGVELCCTPAWEARSFAVSPPSVWPRIARLQCPLTLLTADHQSTCDASSVRRFMRLRPGTTLEIMAQASHFLPMEYPQRVREQILAAVTPHR